jgi:hypothetical protein
MRIFEIKTALMKARINLTVEEEVLKKAKYYAEEHNTSVSEMVETYLKKITQKANKEKPYFLKVLENFKPKEDYNNRDLTKEYYEAKGKKYGY